MITRRQSLRVLGGAACLLPGHIRSAGENPAPMTRPIPSSGEKLPVIGMGTWQTMDIGEDENERAPMAEVLREFVKLGGRLVDSSPMYGRSETVLGDLSAANALRESLFVATKVWITGKEQGIAQMEESMRKLRSPVIDLMQVHNLVDADTHLDTLRAWKKEGRIRHLGITHYHAGNHDAVEKFLASVPLDFIQINYSVAEREAEKRLLPLAMDKGVAVIINRPFAGGGLIRDLLRKPLPPFAAEIACESWAQLLLKFLISHPAVTAAIPATTKVHHLRDNMKAAHGPLPDEKLRERIAEAIR